MTAITDAEIDLVEFAYRQRIKLVGSDREISESLIARIRADAATIAELRRQVAERDAQIRTLISRGDDRMKWARENGFDLVTIRGLLNDYDAAEISIGYLVESLRALAVAARERDIAERDATIARLRAVARAARDERWRYHRPLRARAGRPRRGGLDMGVDFFNCERCNKIICDAGNYESCDACGANFCSADCAQIQDADTDDQTCAYCRGDVVSEYDNGFAAANWLRWCDAWVAIGLAAEGCHGAARVASNGHAKIYAEWELLARQAMARSMGIPAAEAK